MDRALPILEPSRPPQTCVWMDAGFLAFRLCDRGFDCEHCPFDAAMRRDPRAAASGEHDAPQLCPAPWSFPPNRLYTDGHVWVQTIRDGRVRAGIDAYASRLIHPLRRLRPAGGAGSRERGEPWCVLAFDGGEVPLGLPLAGRASCWNSALEQTPMLATSDPYGGGWLGEIDLAQARDLDTLLHAGPARDHAACDARQFRRNVAFQLLSGDGEPALDGPFLEAAMRLVGPGPFVAMARRFLH